MLGLVLTALLVQPASTLTLTEHACRLRVALEAASAQSRIHLGASPDLAEEIVAIRVRNVGLEAFEEHLADVLNAQWFRHGDNLVLMRSSQRMAARRQPFLDARIRALKGTSPVGFDTRELIHVVGFDRLARVRRDENVTFSTNPRVDQELLDSGANAVIEAYLRATPKVELGEQHVAKTDVDITWYDASRAAEMMVGGLATLTDGREISISGGSYTVDGVPWGDWVKLEAARKGGSPSLAPDPVTADFLTCRQASIGSLPHPSPAERAAISRMRKRLTHATDVDPLWFASDLFVAYAKAKDEQFVGWLPDRLTDDTLRVPAFGQNLAEFELGMHAYASVEVEEQNGWVSVTPRDVDFAVAGRADRPFLNEIGAYANGTRSLSIDALASLESHGLRTFNYLEGSDARVNVMDPVSLWASLAPYPTQLIHEVVRSDERIAGGTYTFWTSLSREQRGYLETGNRVPINLFTDSQRMFLLAQANAQNYDQSKPREQPKSVSYSEDTLSEVMTVFDGAYETIVPSWV
ncbi:MAG TPA: hypothetical protein VKT78_07680, partial [Fimbriimonadaceae bacterium]|nr:hypothetical protein [Fimbriimonadaceae bacterium]